MVSQSLITDLAFEGQAIRLVRNGELWFVLADVCQALEIANHRDVPSRLDDDEKGVATIDTPGGPQEMLIVSEPGLYKLIATSRKPAFERTGKSFDITTTRNVRVSSVTSQLWMMTDLFLEFGIITISSIATTIDQPQ